MRSLTHCIAVGSLAALAFSPFGYSADPAERLDKDGSLYVYVELDLFQKRLEEKRKALGELLKQELEDAGEDTIQTSGMIVKIYDLIVNSIGFNQIQSFGMSNKAIGDGVYSTKQFFHSDKQNPEGLIWDLATTVKVLEDAYAFAPESSAAYGYTGLSLGELWEQVVKIIADIPIPGGMNIEKQAAHVLASQGIDLQKLVSSVGDEVFLVATVDTDSTVAIPFPSPNGEQMTMSEGAIAIVLKVNSDYLFKIAEEKLTNNPSILKEETDEFRKLTAQFPFPMLSPTLMLRDGYLVLSTNSDLVNEMFAVKNGKKPGLLASESFRKKIAGMPTTGTAFSTVSMNFWQWYLEFMDVASTLNPNMKLQMKPVGMRSVCAVQQSTLNSLYSESRSNSCPQMMLADLVMMIPEASARGVMLAKKNIAGKIVRDQGNLKQMGYALRMYSSDYREKFPDDLALLAELDYLTALMCYVSPLGGTPPPANIDALRNGQTDYIYLGEGKTERFKGILVVTDPMYFEDGTTNALFSDGHVEQVPVDAELQKRIDEVMLEKGF